MGVGSSAWFGSGLLGLVEVMDDVLFVALPALENHIVWLVSFHVLGRNTAMNPPANWIERSESNRPPEYLLVNLRVERYSFSVVITKVCVEERGSELSRSRPVSDTPRAQALQSFS
jgi:hypothetical protein